MKRIVLLVLVFAFMHMAHSQNHDTQLLEKQFENSDLYFQRYYLNTFALNNLSTVAPGFFSDTFMRLSLNPAFGLADTSRNYKFYLDYQSNRAEQVPRVFFSNFYGIPNQPPYINLNPCWYRISRSEPMPFFSVGFSGRISSRLQLTTAYQLIYKEEPFYRQPIYFYGLETFDDHFAQDNSPPVIFYRQRRNNTLTRAHLLATYLSYQINAHLWAGIGVDVVLHKRDAHYLNLSSDHLNRNELASESKDRGLTYNHHDISAGLVWLANPKWQFGIQAGRLNGRAKQNEVSLDSSIYGSHYSGHRQALHFDHDGNRYYSTVTLRFSPHARQTVFAFFHYSLLHNNLRNYANIHENDVSICQNQSGLQNNRSESTATLFNIYSDDGSLNENHFESMFSLRVAQNNRTVMRIGFYFSYLTGEKKISEPVRFDYCWRYLNQNDTNYYERISRHKEDKMIYWHYRYTKQSVQMPVYVRHKINDNLALFAIINKVWTAWRTNEKTDAFYREWYNLYNGNESIKQNFIKRYRLQPDDNQTKDSADLALGFDVRPVHNIFIRYLINPDFGNNTRISQWELSIYLNLSKG